MIGTALRQTGQSIRTLSRRPAFSATVVLTLGLGIGATTAIFSVVSGILLRPLPYPEPEEVMQLRRIVGDDGSILSVSYPDFLDLREQSRTFDALGAYAGRVITGSTGGQTVRVQATEVSNGFFQTLDVDPALGRGFLPEELETGGAPVAIASHGYWQQYLGGAADLSAATVRVGEETHKIVGVMPLGFGFPVGSELWLPSDATTANQSRTAGNFLAIGRLAESVTSEQAIADLSAIARRLKDQYGDQSSMVDATLTPVHEQLVGGVRPALLILLSGAGLLLLIACANVVNLLLARMETRERELSVRLALGASRPRVVGQLLSEAAALSMVGGLLGFILASWGIPLLLALEPGGLPRVEDVAVDGGAFLFSLGLSLGAALIMGLVPAWRVARNDIRGSLSGGGRSQTQTAWRNWVLRGIAAAQVSLTLVLLVGGGLLGRSFLSLIRVDLGYRTQGSVVIDLWSPPAEGFQAGMARSRFQAALEDRLRAVPGVDAAGGISAFPLSGQRADGSFVVLDSPDEVAGLPTFDEVMARPELLQRVTSMFRDPARAGYAQYRLATAGYFQALGIPLMRGRLFNDSDTPDAPHVAVISQSLADQRWPGEDPIGKVIEYGNMDGDLTPFTIVGIVGDVRERSVEAEPEPTFYGNAAQRPGPASYHLVVRADAAASAIGAVAREAVRELNPDVALRARAIEEILSTSLAERRFALVLLGAFGVTALLIAWIGVYGVISFLVSQRRREMGIRMVVGAKPRDVVQLVLGESAALVLVGLGVGVLVALAATRLLAGMLYGVDAIDPVVFATVALTITVVGLLAGYFPARSATRVDPVASLRSE